MAVIFELFSILFWFVALLVPLIAIHEFGHLLMARLVGVRIVEYGIGMPPRAWSKYWKGIVWSLNWLPLGGFARIYGDHDALDEAQYIMDDSGSDEAREFYLTERYEELIRNRELRYFLELNNLEYDKDWKALEEDDKKLGPEDHDRLKSTLSTLIEWEFDQKIAGKNNKNAFFAKRLWQKILILAGGVTFNFITAIFIFWVILSFIGTPPLPQFNDDIAELQDRGFQVERISENVVVFNVTKDSPAEKAGLEYGSELLSINGNQLDEVETNEQFINIVQQFPTVELEFKNRDGEVFNKDIELEEIDGQRRIGIESFGYTVSYKAPNVVEGFQGAINQTIGFSRMQIFVLGDIVQAIVPGQESEFVDQVGGPLRIGSVGAQIFSLQGASGILNVAALISISLAVLNLLPIPALDGGRMVLVVLNAILGKRNKKIEGLAIGVSFVALLALSLLIAFRDVLYVFF